MVCVGFGLFLKNPSVHLHPKSAENMSSNVLAVVFLSLTSMLDTNENKIFAITIPLKSFASIDLFRCVKNVFISYMFCGMPSNPASCNSDLPIMLMFEKSKESKIILLLLHLLKKITHIATKCFANLFYIYY